MDFLRCFFVTHPFDNASSVVKSAVHTVLLDLDLLHGRSTRHIALGLPIPTGNDIVLKGYAEPKAILARLMMLPSAPDTFT